MATKTPTKVIPDPKAVQPTIALTRTGLLDSDAVSQWVEETSGADGLTSFPEPKEMEPAARVIQNGPFRGIRIQIGSPLSSPTLTAIRSTPTDLGSLSTDRTVTSLTAAPESTASP
jgi:hypothetical protein